MSGPPYDVFLSFRGPDTRNHFADFLYDGLSELKIAVFRDEEELEKGMELNPQLIQAIEQSKISIPIISEKYASSNSCLMELEKMVECEDKNQQTIIPIFYQVDPKDVRNCLGTFEMADEKQKCALHRIGNLTGYHHVERSDKHHSKIIKRVVREVELKMKLRDLIMPKQLVGVDHHVQEITAKLKVDYRNGQEVKIGDTIEKVLIYGIAGVGKTVLAKCVYNKLNHLYDACGFLEKIQENIEREDVLFVQNRLNSLLHKTYAQMFDCSDHALTRIEGRILPKKVLLLLDDVKDCDQLSELVGKLDWLGLGSTVIVTSRRDDVLDNFQGAEKFGLRPMQKDKALQLFSWYAFAKDSPPKHLEELSTKIVAASGRLPLALQIGESLFREENRKVWMETPTLLEQAPDRRVREAFLKSYNTLEQYEKEIFLDIACFFNGKDKRIPYYMWEDCSFFPSKSFVSLHAMSWVEIGKDEKLCMPEILENLGRSIVKDENWIEPRKRSRLWNHKEALDVLNRGKGTGKVVALGLKFADGSAKDNTIFKCNKFDGLQNLRFLKLDQADIQGDFGDRLSKLSWLDWRGCPKIFYAQSLNLNLRELVILDLSWSQVDKDWRGWELLKQASKLKVLRLTGCVQLTATPEFPASMLLERLILEGCSRLAVIDPSIGNLTRLVSLNVKGCSLLRELPDLGLMKDLEELLIDGTSICLNNFQEGSKMVPETHPPSDCKDLTEQSDWILYLM